MKKRPTIALAMIMKNEAHNIGPLFNSISGCFDAIFVADTGSDDNTVDILISDKTKEVAGCDIVVSYFNWVKDFSKARQFVFDQITEDYDYIMWLDADDLLSDKDKFIHFRDHSMHCADAWLVNYNYAYENGEPVCTFFRERIVRNNGAWRWQYFLHEGLVTDIPQKTQFIGTFTINHMRTKADQIADKNRNVAIFEAQIANGEELAPRMIYYYGKELFDAERYLDSIEWLQKAAEIKQDLQLHDRVMCMQMLSMAYGKCGEWQKALHIGLNGLQLAPSRAEFWLCCADALVSTGKSGDAKLFYQTAKSCKGGNIGGALYSAPDAKLAYPAHQLAQIYLQEINVSAAEPEIEILEKINHPKAKDFRAQLENIKSKNRVPDANELTQTEDIVITTPPGAVTKTWDEHALEKEGMGGSETAAVEVARLLKARTGRSVKIFTHRDTAAKMPSGVEYLPLSQVESYFRNYSPKVHIAWRHTAHLTKAPTFVWSHDLLTPGAEHQNYEKLWCLTEFHKNFVMDMQGVSPEKIDIVNNGIDPKLFKEKLEKKPFKVIFSSSPDRGWSQTIEICRLAREKHPEIELHLFYGTGNMRKMGREEEANYLDSLVSKHDWVQYHGFVSKKELIDHFKESAVWLYPADFIETSCITAMEAVCAGAFPLVRNMGALPNTLEKADRAGICEILDKDPNQVVNHKFWAERLSYHLENQSFKKVQVDPMEYSWESRIDAYLQSMGL